MLNVTLLPVEMLPATLDVAGSRFAPIVCRVTNTCLALSPSFQLLATTAATFVRSNFKRIEKIDYAKGIQLKFNIMKMIEGNRVIKNML